MKTTYNDIGVMIFHGLGDVVFTTIVIRALRNKYKNRKITVITAKSYIDIFNQNIDIDELISLDGNPLALDHNYTWFKKKFKMPITPAPSIYGYAGDTLCQHWKNLTLQFTDKINFIPNIAQNNKEKEAIEAWLDKRKIDNFVILESRYGSSQSWWKIYHTKEIIKFITNNTNIKLLMVNENPLLYKNIYHNNIIDARIPYKQFIYLYNKCSGFIGVSSGLSVLSHSNNTNMDIPHIECVKGIHWSTHLLHKNQKTIIMDEKKFPQCIKMISNINASIQKN